MKKVNLSKKLSVLMLCAAMTMIIVGCGNKIEDQVAAGEWVDGGEIGEGATSFDFVAVNGDDVAEFTVNTDEEMVGMALQEVGLIDGEQSEFGLYVKTVNGVLADYDVDQTFWAFLVDGEMAMVGVDQTAIEEGKVYTLEVTK